MAGLSNYLETKLIDHILRALPYTAPTTVFVSLHSSDPTDAGLNTEVTGGGYARASIVCAQATWSNSDGEAKNAGLVTFPEPTGSWGTVTYFGIWDAATGGNLLFVAPLTTTRVVEQGDVVSFPVDFLNIVFD